jgi:hypothetical protein
MASKLLHCFWIRWHELLLFFLLTVAKLPSFLHYHHFQSWAVYCNPSTTVHGSWVLVSWASPNIHIFFSAKMINDEFDLITFSVYYIMRFWAQLSIHVILFMQKDVWFVLSSSYLGISGHGCTTGESNRSLLSNWIVSIQCAWTKVGHLGWNSELILMSLGFPAVNKTLWKTCIVAAGLVVGHLPSPWVRILV